MTEKNFSEMTDAEIWGDLRAAHSLSRPKRNDSEQALREAAEALTQRLFPRVEPGWCCKAMRGAKARGLHHLALATGDGITFVRVFYCPRCGRAVRE